MFAEIVEQVSYCGIDAEAVQFIACAYIVRFVRENNQITNKSTVRMCCRCYSPILTLKGNICGLEMTIGRLLIALLPVHLCCAMVPPGMESVHKAQTSDRFGPLPNRDGGWGQGWTWS